EISNDEISEENGTSLIINEEQNEIEEQSMDKMEQFKSIMNDIILSALKENNAELTEEIGANVTEGVIKEMKFLLRLQEEKQEERFRKLDTTIRDYQKSRMLAAAGLEIKSRKKSKFFKKNNRAYI
ncbi:MAG: transcriptional regulator, partial [Clostridiales bacterium]|nr:transcriptional regulator [Clostridiales bacterium]